MLMWRGRYEGALRQQEMSWLRSRLRAMDSLGEPFVAREMRPLPSPRVELAALASSVGSPRPLTATPMTQPASQPPTEASDGEGELRSVESLLPGVCLRGYLAPLLRQWQ